MSGPVDHRSDLGGEAVLRGGVYTNYVDRDESDRIEEAWGSNQARLRRVKAVNDPDVFSGNVGLGSG